MKQEGLIHFSDIHLTIIGLILFFSVFMGVIFWVYRKSAKKHFEKMSQMPLDDKKIQEERNNEQG